MTDTPTCRTIKGMRRLIQELVLTFENKQDGKSFMEATIRAEVPSDFFHDIDKAVEVLERSSI